MRDALNERERRTLTRLCTRRRGKPNLTHYSFILLLLVLYLYSWLLAHSLQLQAYLLCSLSQSHCLSSMLSNPSMLLSRGSGPKFRSTLLSCTYPHAQHGYLLSIAHHYGYAYIFYRESLYESEELPQETHNAAALLASKVYYYLGEYGETLSFALSAGAAFEAESRTPGSEEYVETVVCE